MTTRDYGTPSDSNKSTTKETEVHGNSQCSFQMKKLKKKGVEVYVWFRFCYCGDEDRSEDYKKIADGDSLPRSYSIKGIYVHYNEACQYLSVPERSKGGLHYKIKEKCYCQ